MVGRRSRIEGPGCVHGRSQRNSPDLRGSKRSNTLDLRAHGGSEWRSERSHEDLSACDMGNLHDSDILSVAFRWHPPKRLSA